MSIPTCKPSIQLHTILMADFENQSVIKSRKGWFQALLLGCGYRIKFSAHFQIRSKMEEKYFDKCMKDTNSTNWNSFISFKVFIKYFSILRISPFESQFFNCVCVQYSPLKMCPSGPNIFIRYWL